jgi:hypothetical protein
MDGKALRSATFTLHRYYMWTNRMRVHMEEKLPTYSEQLKKDTNDIWTTEGIETFMYMSYWYAGLYVSPLVTRHFLGSSASLQLQ